MKILITGINGFVGRNLAEALARAGHTVCGVDKAGNKVGGAKTYENKTGGIDEISGFIKVELPDGIIHLASVFIAEHTKEEIDALIESNVAFPSKVMQAASENKVRWFINTGSIWQNYGNNEYLPVNLYAATKQAFEDIAKYYYDSCDINFITLRLSDTYGPGDPRPKIINKWIEMSQKGAEIDMSEGRQVIDFSYIDDVVSAYLKAVEYVSSEKKVKGEVFNVLSGDPHTMQEAAEIFQKASGRMLKINWGKKEYRRREMMTPADVNRRVPGWEPKIKLEEGLRRVLKKNQ
ncbi:MAG: NAD(P)-dependent oxidoreductase [Endomicrobiales bacterium]|nr:NAD(P)-dependent oxidoreductase [Endomicrobiales bacterium]